MPMLRQNNIKKKKKKESLQDWSNGYRNPVVVFLFLRTCLWCEVVFVLRSRWLGTSLSGTVQVMNSGQLTGGGTRLHLFFFPFWLRVFILPPRSWRVREGEKWKGERTGSERWEWRGSGKSVQHGSSWRSWLGAWGAQEPSRTESPSC